MASAFSAGHDFSLLPVRSPLAGVLQAKLAVDRPGDEFEQEADRLARNVMHAPEPQVQPKCACGGTCASCQKEPSGPSDAPPLVHEALCSPSQPIDRATHDLMAARLGHDFSHVRVHADSTAAASASALNALAYTVGHDVVFGPGTWAPATSAGRGLLAHELVHVMQQERSTPLLQRQVVPAGSASDQADFVRETIRFLEQSAEHYQLVAKVDATLFDRVGLELQILVLIPKLGNVA